MPLRVWALFLVLGVVVRGDDFGVMLQRMHQRALASSATTTVAVADALSHWREDGSFDNVDYDDGETEWYGAQHWDHVRALAWAWAEPKSYRYHNKELGERIYKSVIFWHRVRPCPVLNWWWNQIGVPLRSFDALILSRPLLRRTEEGQKAQMTPLMATTLKSENRETLPIQAEIVFKRGVLERNMTMMREAAAIISAELTMAVGGRDGVMSDGCFHANGPRNRLGTYGLACLEHAVSFAGLTVGTSFELNEKRMEILRKLALDGFAWTLWCGRLDPHVMGGRLGQDDLRLTGGRAVRSLKMLAEFDKAYRRGYLTALVGNEEKGENAFVGAKVFWQSDFAVFRRPDYYASMTMTSNRTCPFDDDMMPPAQASRYFSDGTLLVLMTGDEYNDMPAFWNWTRLPGTTLPGQDMSVRLQKPTDGAGQASRSMEPLGMPPQARGEEAFTGAATSGLHLAAVYRQNVDGVTALKSVFFAPDGIVCLGAGVTSVSRYPVATTVEQRRLSGDVLERAGGIWHDRIAYLGDGLQKRAEMVRGRLDFAAGKNKDASPLEIQVLTIEIDHGIACKDGTYAYEIRPCVSRANFMGLQSTGRILSNTKSLQAVEFKDGSRCAVFHEAGSLGEFGTDTPCVWILEKGKMYLADPTHHVERMNVRWRGKELSLDMPRGNQAGTTVSMTID